MTHAPRALGVSSGTGRAWRARIERTEKDSVVGE